MARPSVYVLVINWNGREHLEACFDSLLKSTYQRATFVLIDNASSDGSVQFVQSEYGDDPRVRIVEAPENIGWSRGNNLGLERALEEGADYVLLLNNDTRIEPDAISILVDTAEAEPDAGALAPKLLLFDQPWLLNGIGLEASVIGSAWDRGIGRIDAPVWDAITEVIGGCGAGFFIRVDVLRRTGLLPEDFDIYLDDLDLALRIWRAGYRVLACPMARIHHKFSATMGTGDRARRKYYLNTRNRYRLLLRNYSVSQMVAAFPRCAKGELKAFGGAIRDGEWWRVAAHLRSGMDAVSYFPRAQGARHKLPREGAVNSGHTRLLRDSPLFFPGIPLPKNGWYEACRLAGAELRPMSLRAVYHHRGGEVRITSHLKDPELPSHAITLTRNSDVVARLSDAARSCAISLPVGEVHFESSGFHPAETTGEPVDIGGWIEFA